MRGYSTPHTRDTANPQTYIEHWRFACLYASQMIWYGLAGLIHSVLPEIKSLQFATSSFLIRTFKGLVLSGRHDGEIERILGTQWRDLAARERKGAH